MVFIIWINSKYVRTTWHTHCLCMHYVFVIRCSTHKIFLKPVLHKIYSSTAVFTNSTMYYLWTGCHLCSSRFRLYQGCYCYFSISNIQPGKLTLKSLVQSTIDNSSYGSLGEFLLLKTLTTMLSFECHFLGLNSFFKNLIKHLKWSSTTKYRKHLRRRLKRIKNSLHYYLNIWSFFFSCEIAFFRLQRGTNIHQIVTYIIK